jgi:glyoxylase-like metal-dependent hydrolase (beta-lactamase superfamily II)
MNELRYEVLVNDGVRRQRAQRLPDGSPIVSSPVASTLIYGDHDAVLVDPPFTREQVARVGDWIERSSRTLAFIYATHGHGDHWFGTDLLAQRIRGAIAYATEGTIAIMHQQATAGRAELWDIDFPGLIPPARWSTNPFPSTGSSSSASACWRSRSATPTPTTPRFCMCRPSAWWWLAT